MVTFKSLIERKDKIAVVGLGYVGLPLAVRLSKYFDVIGYDLKSDRIEELRSQFDRTMEVTKEDLGKANILYTYDPKDLSKCRLIIIAVPTPIDSHRIPNLEPLRSASKISGEHMVKGTCLVFESTVYPGATEEVCVPILASSSGLTFEKDFKVGYSPERINPGDKEHSLETIAKIVSGCDPETAHFLSKVYGQIINANIHIASSIKVAEAAKVIENTQRDLNIALMNELAMIFDKLGIDTTEVLQAAGTKWNFLPFKPGLVGGHCIGVDPYYLTFQAEAYGFHPEMILAGRRINDNMGKYIAEQTVKMLINAGKMVSDAKISLLGITFKENVPDLRNTRVLDIINELEDYGINVFVHDSMADPEEAKTFYDIELKPWEELSGVDAVIVAVIHNTYKDKGLKNIAGLCSGENPLVFDIKGAFSVDEAKKEKITYRRL